MFAPFCTVFTMSFEFFVRVVVVGFLVVDEPFLEFIRADGGLAVLHEYRRAQLE